MGDHRASIKIEMEFHGVKDKCDMWINYSPDTSAYPGVDYRIVDFITSVYDRGMAKYDAHCAKLERESHAQDIERSERAELERLTAKYGKERS